MYELTGRALNYLLNDYMPEKQLSFVPSSSGHKGLEFIDFINSYKTIVHGYLIPDTMLVQVPALDMASSNTGKSLVMCKLTDFCQNTNLVLEAKAIKNGTHHKLIIKPIGKKFEIEIRSDGSRPMFELSITKEEIEKIICWIG